MRSTIWWLNSLPDRLLCFWKLSSNYFLPQAPPSKWHVAIRVSNQGPPYCAALLVATGCCPISNRGERSHLISRSIKSDLQQRKCNDFATVGGRTPTSSPEAAVWFYVQFFAAAERQRDRYCPVARILQTMEVRKLLHDALFYELRSCVYQPKTRVSNSRPAGRMCPTALSLLSWCVPHLAVVSSSSYPCFALIFVPILLVSSSCLFWIALHVAVAKQLTSTLKKETVGYSDTLGTASKTTTRCHNSEVRSTHFHRRENLNIVHLYPVSVNIRYYTAATSGRIVYITGFSPKKHEPDRKSVSLHPPISCFVIRVAASKRFPLQKYVSTFCFPPVSAKCYSYCGQVAQATRLYTRRKQDCRLCSTRGFLWQLCLECEDKSSLHYCWLLRYHLSTCLISSVQ
jgi:hypothetical protein